jgi:hypothetical protein
VGRRDGYHVLFEYVGEHVMSRGNPDVVCGICQFWDVFGTEPTNPDVGLCRVRVPQRHWPITSSWEWCGDFILLTDEEVKDE